MRTKTRTGRMLAVLLTLALALGMSPMVSQAAVPTFADITAFSASFVPEPRISSNPTEVIDIYKGSDYYDIYYVDDRLPQNKTFTVTLTVNGTLTDFEVVSTGGQAEVKNINETNAPTYTFDIDVSSVPDTSAGADAEVANPIKLTLTTSEGSVDVNIRAFPTGRVGYYVDGSGVTDASSFVNIGPAANRKNGSKDSANASTFNAQKGGWAFDLGDDVIIAIKPDSGKVPVVELYEYFPRGTGTKITTLTKWVPGDTTVRYDSSNNEVLYGDVKATETWYHIGEHLANGIDSHDYLVKVTFVDESTSNPPPYIPPFVGGGSTSEGGSSESGETGEGGSTGEAAPEDITVDEAIEAAAAAAQAAADEGEDSAVVKFKNPGEIAVESFLAMVEAADGTQLTVHADSMNGNAVDVRLYIDPSLATQDMNLSASTVSEEATGCKEYFEQYFENDLFAVTFGHKGEFGMTIRAAAKVDPEMNTDNLFFYTYDEETNQYTRIKKPNYRVDKNGYVHFDTDMGGAIIISDGPLKKP